MIGVVELNALESERRPVRCDYAIALVLDYAFNDLEVETVRSACLTRNPVSGRVLEKNGFGEGEGFIYDTSKFKSEPARRFSLTREEWLAL